MTNHSPSTLQQQLINRLAGGWTPGNSSPLQFYLGLVFMHQNIMDPEFPLWVIGHTIQEAVVGLPSDWYKLATNVTGHVLQGKENQKEQEFILGFRQWSTRTFMEYPLWERLKYSPARTKTPWSSILSERNRIQSHWHSFSNTKVGSNQTTSQKL